MIEHITRKLTHIALLIVMLYAAGASADEFKAPLFSFRGFGTLGVVHSSEDQADFTSSILKPNGAGYSHTWSADYLQPDRRAGHCQYHPEALGRPAGHSGAEFRQHLPAPCGVVEYPVSGHTGFQCARRADLTTPTFLLSDTRKVAYTYPFVRPPLEVYRLFPAYRQRRC